MRENDDKINLMLRLDREQDADLVEVLEPHIRLHRAAAEMRRLIRAGLKHDALVARALEEPLKAQNRSRDE